MLQGSGNLRLRPGQDEISQARGDEELSDSRERPSLAPESRTAQTEVSWHLKNHLGKQNLSLGKYLCVLESTSVPERYLVDVIWRRSRRCR